MANLQRYNFSVNNDYAKCADEVLTYTGYSKNGTTGKGIVEIIKRHFA